MDGSLLAALGQLLSHAGDLQHLTKWQMVTLAGFALGGAATAATIRPGNYVFIACGALAGIVPHLSGQLQTSPMDRAAKIGAAKAQAAAEQAAQAAMQQPVSSQPTKDDVFATARGAR